MILLMSMNASRRPYLFDWLMPRGLASHPWAAQMIDAGITLAHIVIGRITINPLHT